MRPANAINAHLTAGHIPVGKRPITSPGAKQPLAWLAAAVLATFAGAAGSL